ncbi:MAG: exo-alpha-sialidase [Bacteroidaceae bacterium]|nr:exo-alpha-sialidase [Bacteroidaceae bacterium]
MKTKIIRMLWTMALVMGFTTAAQAQTSVAVSTQITKESDLVSGNKYVLQSMASGTPYIMDAGTYYSVPNKANTATTACVYYFYKNDDGTWMIKNQHTGKYWGVPVYGSELEPCVVYNAGAWSLNFSGGISYPRAKTTDGSTVLSIDRSSQKIVGWTTKTSGNAAQGVKIFAVEAALSSEPLLELEHKMVAVSATPANDLTTGQWYTIYDRGLTDGTKPHGYLYENSGSHKLFNTATAPSGLATKAAKYLLRLTDAGDGNYYIQNGFGNYFGTIEHNTQVAVVAGATEAIAVKKIAGTDGHFYLQGVSTGVILDANDLSAGDAKATVVGWGNSVPTSIGGNNDWAFYPVELDDIPAEIALFESDVTVSRGYQTTGRGNADALLLRIDITPSQVLQKATFRFALDAATRDNISSLYLYDTKETEFLANIPAAPVGSATEIGTTTDIKVENITAGLHRLWLCATVKDDAQLGAILKAALTTIDYTTSADASFDASAIGNPDRQGMKVFDQQIFLFKPTTDNCRYYRIPAMILDENDNIVVAADKRYNSNSDLGNHKIDVVSLRSEDGGRTWKDYATIAVGDGYTAAYFGYGDAALARATNGDLVCIMASGSKTWGYGMVTAGFARSTDNGKSWTLIKNLLDSPAFYDENSNDGSLSVTNIFTTSGKGLTTTDGVIMFTTNCKNNLGTVNYILYSTDNGAHWRLSNAVAYTGTDESKLEQRNDGSLLLSVRQSGNRGWNTATYTKNADGTVTFHWGTQTRTGDIWGNACNADILYYSRQSDTDPDILLHSYINTSGRQSLQMSMSLNGGKTWKDVYNIQPNGSCYSTMIQLPSGNVALLFEDESYSAGNGYAINFVTITREQILDWFVKAGGELPVGIESLPAMDKAESSKFNVQSSMIYNLAGQQLSKPQRGVNIINGKKVVVK